MAVADSEFVKPLVNSLHGWLPQVTVDVWNKEEDKDVSRKVNAELRKALKPKAIASATMEVEATLNTVEGQREAITSLIRKETEKAVRSTLKSQRKNLRAMPQPMRRRQGPERMVASQGETQPSQLARADSSPPAAPPKHQGKANLAGASAQRASPPPSHRSRRRARKSSSPLPPSAATADHSQEEIAADPAKAAGETAPQGARVEQQALPTPVATCRSVRSELWDAPAADVRVLGGSNETAVGQH